MEEERTFELEPVLNDSTGHYVVKDFDNVRKIVSDFIIREVNSVLAITDDVALKSVKALRTDIRKKKDAITKARLNINALLLGDFNAQLKLIEEALDKADKSLKEKVDTYNEETKGKDNKPRVITLVVKCYDEKIIEKVKEFALKNGCTAEVK